MLLALLPEVAAGRLAADGSAVAPAAPAPLVLVAPEAEDDAVARLPVTAIR